MTTTNTTPGPLSVGNAIQIGLMGATGYFDSWVCCGIPMGPWFFLPDWLVETAEDLGPREQYRYRVRGKLREPRDDDPLNPEFFWDVPSLCWRFAFLDQPGTGRVGSLYIAEQGEAS